MRRIWRLWAKALGEKASENNLEADIVALIRTFIVIVAVVCNLYIIAGIERHWNDNQHMTLKKE